MKLGLDYDGVINKLPRFFSILTKLFVAAGHEVHIITGNRGTAEFLKNLKKMGISYTHFFSISDYHHGIGTPMTGYEENHTWIAEDLWDRTKGNYCAEHGIDLHVDDSPVYGKYFRTPYLYFSLSKAA